MTRLTVSGACPECGRRVTMITDLPDGISRPADASPIMFDLHCDECSVDFIAEQTEGGPT